MPENENQEKREEWMEQKVGGVEKRGAERVFVQPAEGLKMLDNGNAFVQMLAKPGDSVEVRYGNSFEQPYKLMMTDEKGNGLFTAELDKKDLKGPQRVAFIVNGVEKLNTSMQMLYHANTLSNYVEFPDPETEDLIRADKEIEHGAVSHVFYYSEAFQTMMSTQIYTPPGYEEGSDYPVLYFFHECGENRLAWTDAPRTNYLFDNMIAEKKCSPFLMAEVDCTMSLAYHDQADFFEGFDTLEQFLIKDCAGYVESHYKVKKDKWSRAIAGIGLGAIQAGYIGLRNTDFYGSVAAFTAFWPSMDFHEHGKEDPIYNAVEKLGQNPDVLRVFYRSEGDKDMHYQLIETEDQLMEELGVSKMKGYVSEVHKGVEHSWGSYRRSFRDFLPLAFPVEP